MDHEAASPLLSDWIARRLNEVSSTDVARHIADCAECRGIAESLVAVRGEVAEHGDALWSPHPSSDDLAQFTSGGAALATDALARIGAHVQACATCAVESRLGREAQVSSVSRMFRAWLPEVSDGRAVTAIALGALAVVLAYPAYIGLIEYPKARVHGQRLEQQTERAPLTPTPLARVEGPAAVLILEGPTRGGREALPAVTLRSGQAALPVLIDEAPPAGDHVEIVLRDASGRTQWQLTARGAELWDQRQHVLSLMIPTSVLGTGEFELSIGAPGQPTSAVHRFSVMTSGAAPR